MQAGLAILSGSRAERPDVPRSGFRQWDQAVRWPLLNAGVADPVSKFDDVRENSPDHERMTAWMLGLAHGFRGRRRLSGAKPGAAGPLWPTKPVSGRQPRPDPPDHHVRRRPGGPPAAQGLGQRQVHRLDAQRTGRPHHRGPHPHRAQGARHHPLPGRAPLAQPPPSPPKGGDWGGF